METRKQFEKRVKNLERKVYALADKAMSSHAGLAEVEKEIGCSLQSGSKAVVMQALADKLLLPIGLRYVVVDIFADVCRLQVVCATRPLQ